MRTNQNIFVRNLLTVSLCLVTALGLVAGSFPASASRLSQPINLIPPANVEAAQRIRGIENPAALNSFFQALADIKQGRRREPVRIAHYGDSHTAANILTAEVRRNFERDFQRADESMYARSIRYDVLGINGARAVRLLSMSEPAFAASVEQRKPDLIILAYGTNEVTDNNWSVESYQRMFIQIMRRFRRSAPNASILIFGPPDRAVRGRSGWQSAARMTALLEAQRRAAIEMGAAFWSSYSAMGGAGSMNSWVAQGLGQRDHVHLTAPGYVKLGDMFYEDILSAYEGRRPGRSTGADTLQLNDAIKGSRY